MAFVQKPNTGTLFRNTKKTKPEQPDYTGSANIAGQELSVGAWLKEGKQGKFFSMAYRPKQIQQVGQRQYGPKQMAVEFEGEEVPF